MVVGRQWGGTRWGWSGSGGGVETMRVGVVWRDGGGKCSLRNRRGCCKETVGVF